MRVFLSINFLQFCILLFCANIVCAQDWRSIKPLSSTRTDVIRLLGKSPFDEPKSIARLYDVAEGRLNIMYAHSRCEEGLPADWGNWNVKPDTVINMTVHLKKEIKLSKLKIPDIEKYKWYTDDSGATYYRLKDKGIEYEVQNKHITSITYGPTEKDAHLLCRKDAPEIKY